MRLIPSDTQDFAYTVPFFKVTHGGRVRAKLTDGTVVDRDVHAGQYVTLPVRRIYQAGTTARGFNTSTGTGPDRDLDVPYSPTTLPPVSPPTVPVLTGFDAQPYPGFADRLLVLWDNPTNRLTEIRYATSPPAASGTLGFSGAGHVAAITGLAPNTLYYVAAKFVSPASAVVTDSATVYQRTLFVSAVADATGLTVTFNAAIGVMDSGVTNPTKFHLYADEVPVGLQATEQTPPAANKVRILYSGGSPSPAAVLTLDLDAAAVYATTSQVPNLASTNNAVANDNQPPAGFVNGLNDSQFVDGFQSRPSCTSSNAEAIFTFTEAYPDSPWVRTVQFRHAYGDLGTYGGDGTYGVDQPQFNFSNHTGGQEVHVQYRVVLTGGPGGPVLGEWSNTEANPGAYNVVSVDINEEPYVSGVELVELYNEPPNVRVFASVYTVSGGSTALTLSSVAYNSTTDESGEPAQNPWQSGESANAYVAASVGHVIHLRAAWSRQVYDVSEGGLLSVYGSYTDLYASTLSDAPGTSCPVAISFAGEDTLSVSIAADNTRWYSHTVSEFGPDEGIVMAWATTGGGSGTVLRIYEGGDCDALGTEIYTKNGLDSDFTTNFRAAANQVYRVSITCDLSTGVTGTMTVSTGPLDGVSCPRAFPAQSGVPFNVSLPSDTAYWAQMYAGSEDAIASFSFTSVANAAGFSVYDGGADCYLLSSPVTGGTINIDTYVAAAVSANTTTRLHLQTDIVGGTFSATVMPRVTSPDEFCGTITTGGDTPGFFDDGGSRPTTISASPAYTNEPPGDFTRTLEYRWALLDGASGIFQDWSGPKIYGMESPDFNFAGYNGVDGGSTPLTVAIQYRVTFYSISNNLTVHGPWTDNGGTGGSYSSGEVTAYMPSLSGAGTVNLTANATNTLGSWYVTAFTLENDGWPSMQVDVAVHNENTTEYSFGWSGAWTSSTIITADIAAYAGEALTVAVRTIRTVESGNDLEGHGPFNIYGDYQVLASANVPENALAILQVNDTTFPGVSGFIEIIFSTQMINSAGFACYDNMANSMSFTYASGSGSNVYTYAYGGSDSPGTVSYHPGDVVTAYNNIALTDLGSVAVGH